MGRCGPEPRVGRPVDLVAPDVLGHGAEPTGGPVGLGHGAEPCSGPVGLGWGADPVGGGCGAPLPCFAWTWAERRIFPFGWSCYEKAFPWMFTALLLELH